MFGERTEHHWGEVSIHVGRAPSMREEYFGIRRKRELETAQGPANAPASADQVAEYTVQRVRFHQGPNVPRE